LDKNEALPPKLYKDTPRIKTKQGAKQQTFNLLEKFLRFG
jgi:hypothetical protein